MRHMIGTALAMAALAAVASPAMGYGPGDHPTSTDNPGTAYQPEGTPNGSENPGNDHRPQGTPNSTDNPGAANRPSRREARALGREQCQEFKTNFRENRSAFGKCVAAAAKALRTNASPGQACRGMSRRRAEGQRRSDFSACVKAAAAAMREQEEAQQEEEAAAEEPAPEQPAA